jgi:hypothetical protein
VVRKLATSRKADAWNRLHREGEYIDGMIEHDDTIGT